MCIRDSLWAPFTFVIVGFMGFTVGAITEKHHGYGWNALAIAVASVSYTHLISRRRRRYTWLM